MSGIVLAVLFLILLFLLVSIFKDKERKTGKRPVFKHLYAHMVPLLHSNSQEFRKLYGHLDFNAELLDRSEEEAEKDGPIIICVWASSIGIDHKDLVINGILSATSQRLIYCYRRFMDIKVKSFFYEDINDLEVGGNFLIFGIRLRAFGKTVELKRIKGDFREIVRVIQEGMHGRTPRIGG